MCFTYSLPLVQVEQIDFHHIVAKRLTPIDHRLLDKQSTNIVRNYEHFEIYYLLLFSTEAKGYNIILPCQAKKSPTFGNVLMV